MLKNLIYKFEIMFKEIVKILISFIIGKPLNYFLKKKNFIIIFRRGSTIGEHVYMSSVIREISKSNKKILLFTNYYQIYLHNPRIHKLFKIGKKSFLWFFLNMLKSEKILEFNSIHATKNNHENLRKYFLYFHSNNKIHLAHAMSEHFNLNLNYNNLKNEIFFSKNEIKIFEEKISLPPKFSLIQSTSKHSFTKNKEWKVEGMQSIINHFRNIKWIQIGKNGEPVLENCEKMLDLSLREVAYVISKCEFIVTYEGLFNHLASCFQKKSFVIHTGFLPTEAFKYKNNVIIEQNSKMDCYPCFDLDCNEHSKKILNNMENNYVVNKIELNL